MKFTTSLKSITAISLAAFLTACGTNEAAVNPALVAPEVSVAQVVNERLTEWDMFTGRLEAPQNVELRPRVSGYIDIVAFEEGQIVQAGEPLFFIDNRSFKAQVKRNEAAYKSALSRYELAKSEFSRAQNLSAKNAISTEVLDTRSTALQQAEANVDSVKASLELARLQLSYTRVESPITGRVSRALFTEGNFVAEGQTILTSIVSTDSVYAYFDADEQTYLKYVRLNKEGTRPSSREHESPVLMGLATDSDFPYQGYIDFVDNQVNPTTGTIRGRAVFDNSDGQFIPGLFARIKLVGSASYQGILIDDKAVGTDLNNKFVLVLNDENNVEYRGITLGEKLNGLRIVKAGLNAGEQIVVNGLQRVRPGALVSPISVPMTNATNISALQSNQAQIDASFSATQVAQNVFKEVSTQKTTEVVGG